MIKMPEQIARDGRESLIRSIQWAVDNREMSPEVTDYLTDVAKHATLEEIEIIMAWMYIGAVADRLMHQMRAQEVMERIVKQALSVEIDDDGALEA